jgi:DNA-directed RNA polymerase III subunit RPC4
MSDIQVRLISRLVPHPYDPALRTYRLVTPKYLFGSPLQSPLQISHGTMPPKPRGRGSTRARGGARGGATAGREVAATSEATEDAPTPVAATEAPAEAVTPKQEDGDSKPVVAEDEASVAASYAEHNFLYMASEANPCDSAVASPQLGAESTTRAPVQRLGSLQGSVPPSRSASPSVRGRGSTARGKGRAKVPAFTGRRSKEERDAIAKEQAARDKERTKEQVAAEARKEKDRLTKERREANKIRHARGGYSGVASGPFSLGSSKEGMREIRCTFGCANSRRRQEEQPKPRVLRLRFRVRLPSRTHQERGR